MPAAFTTSATMRNDAPAGSGAAPRVPRLRGMSVDPNIVDERARPGPATPPRPLRSKRPSSLGNSAASSPTKPAKVQSRAPSVDVDATAVVLHCDTKPQVPEPPRDVATLRREHEQRLHRQLWRDGDCISVTLGNLSLVDAAGATAAGLKGAAAPLAVVVRHGQSRGISRVCPVSPSAAVLCCFRDALDFPLPALQVAAEDYSCRDLHLQLVCVADATPLWVAGSLAANARGHVIDLGDGQRGLVISSQTLDIKCMAEDAAQCGAVSCAETLELQGPTCAFELDIAWRIAPPGSRGVAQVHSPLRFHKNTFADDADFEIAVSVVAGHELKAPLNGSITQPAVHLSLGSADPVSTTTSGFRAPDGAVEWNEHFSLASASQAAAGGGQLEVQVRDRAVGADEGQLVSVGQVQLDLSAIQADANATLSVDVALMTPAALLRHRTSSHVQAKPLLGSLRLLVSRGAPKDSRPSPEWDDVAVSSLTELALSRVGQGSVAVAGQVTQSASSVPDASLSPKQTTHGGIPSAADPSASGSQADLGISIAHSHGSGASPRAASPVPEEPPTVSTQPVREESLIRRPSRTVGGSKRAPLKAATARAPRLRAVPSSASTVATLPEPEEVTKPGVPGIRLHTFTRAGSRRSSSADAATRKNVPSKTSVAHGLDPNLPVPLDTPTWWRSVPLQRDATLPDGSPGYTRLHDDAVAKEAAAVALFDFDLDVRMPEPDVPRPAWAEFRLPRPWCPPGATDASTHRNFGEVRRAIAADECRSCHGVEPSGSFKKCTCVSQPPSRRASPSREVVQRKRRAPSASAVADRRLTVTSKVIPWYGASTTAANHLAQLFRSAAAAERKS